MKDRSLKELDLILRKHYASRGHEEPYDEDVDDVIEGDDDEKKPARKQDPSKKQDIDIIRMMLATKLRNRDGATSTKKESADY